MDVIREKLLSAESAVIGSILIDPEPIIGDVMTKLTPDHFLDSTFRHIFEAICSLWQAHKAIDPVTVLDALGNPAYSPQLKEIMYNTPTAANVHSYMEIVCKLSRIARMHDIGSQLMLTDDFDEAGRLIEQASTLLAERQDVRVVSIQQGIMDFFERHGDNKPVKSLPYGIRQMDEQISTECGDFVIIGGEPSSGKTAFAVQMAPYIAMRGYRVGIFSLETRDEKIYDRMFAQWAGVPLKRIKKNALNPKDWDKIVSFSSRANNIHLDVIRASRMRVADIQAYTMAGRYDVIFIDYIQQIKAKGSTRYEQVTNISIQLHELAQMGLIVIGLSQLGRIDRNGNIHRMPQMSDLRESGQLEQDAEQIMILQEEGDSTRRELYVIKNKDGERDGQIHLSFDAERVFFSAAPAEQENDDEDDEPPRRRHQGARSKR